MVLSAGLTCAQAAKASTADWTRVRDVFFHTVARDAAIPNTGTLLALAQDGTGFIWVGTDSGVSRWDGQSFRAFVADGSPGALPDPMVRALKADASGRLWVGTLSEGLVRYDPAREVFVRPAEATRLDHERIYALADDGTGGLWIASDGGLSRLDGRTLKISVDVGRGQGLPSGAVSAVAQDGRGGLWAAVGGRAFARPAGGARFTEVALPWPSKTRDAPPHTITSLFADHVSRLWISTSGAGVFAVDPTSGGVRRASLAATGRGAVEPMVTVAIEVRPGVLWFDSHQGLFEIDAANLSVRRLHHDPAATGSLPDDAVNALLMDREGRVWIAATPSLSTADPAAAGAVPVRTALGLGSGGKPYSGWALGVAPDGRVWLGAEDDGVILLDPRTGERSQAGRTVRDASPHGVTAFAFPQDRGVYAAAEAGLYHFGLDGRMLKRVSRSPALRILVDGDTLYVAGTEGLFTLDLRDAAAELKPLAASQRLTDTRVTTLLKAPDGALWIGASRGLNRLDPATGVVETFSADPRNPRALSANYIDSLLFDRRGRLWVGTNSGGLNLFERDASGAGAFRRFTRKDGLPSDVVDALLPGPDGAIWASTDGGLVRIDPQTFAMRTLREAEGAAFLSNWQGGAARTAQGDLLFAGFGGLTVVNPLIAGRQSPRPPLVVTAVSVGQRGVPVGSGGAPARINVPSGAGSVSVEFGALDFAAPERISYSFRMKGYENAWTKTDFAHRTARYTNLPPGDYRLQMRASDRDGRYSGPSLDIPIHVAPAWYQTWAFRLAGLLALIAAIILIMQLRIRALRRRHYALEALIDRRTAELRESQQELEKLAYFDALTELPNRRMFTENINRLLRSARHSRVGFALILIDLDRFKSINDSLGHDAGDALLVEAARRFVFCVRESDSVARLGGDEFAILVSGAEDPETVTALCVRLIESFAAPVLFNGHKIRTSPSIGVALFPDHADTQDALYKAADTALYAAKHSGRNTWRIARAGPPALSPAEATG